MSNHYKQGRFQPKNPGKYKGNPNKIVFRSSWELNQFRLCDTQKNVLAWSSEEVVIPYISPIDGKVHRYFMDIWIRYRGKDGQLRSKLIEIKPYEQTQPPKPQKRRTEKFKKKLRTWHINRAKWKSAKKYCQLRGWQFEIYTEKGKLKVVT